MKRAQPVYLKTYGKERRKLSAWISPDNRRQAFDSTPSTDGDGSVFEPARPSRKRERRPSVAGRRATRPAKRKAVLRLAEESCDQENGSSPSRPQPAQQSKTTRVKKTSVASGRAVRPANRRALLCLTDATSDEEYLSRASPPRRQPAQQSRTSSGRLLSAGRFVTHRRRAAATKLSKSPFNTLDSSDDFTSGAFGSRRAVRPARRPPPPLVSSAENNFATDPLREILLNESTDGGLGPCPRKPIFCSTPSAGSFSKRPRLRATKSNHDQSSSPPSSTSVSCIGFLSPFQEDVDSPGDSAPPIEPDPHHHDAPCGDLSAEPKSSNNRRHCGEGDTRTRTVAGSPSLSLLSADGSCFMSATEGLGWLTEALKERCVTQRCVVRLERLDQLAASQLRGRTAYSSCLGLSSSADSHLSEGGCPTFDVLQSSEPSLRLNLSVSDIKGHDRFTSESSERAASVTDSQSADTSPSAGGSRSQGSAEQSASVIYVDTQLPADEPISSTRTPSAVAVKGERLPKKCTVQLHKTALSHANTSEKERTRDTEDPEDELTEGRTSSTDHSGLVAKEKCRTAEVRVEVSRVTSSKSRETLQLKDATSKSPAGGRGAAGGEDRASHDRRAERDANRRDEESSTDAEKRLSPGSADAPRKGKKTHAAAKKKKKKPRSSTSADRPATTRKACVSGLSVNRWKNHAGAFSSKAADCTINDLVSTQHNQPREWLGSAVSYSTPLRGSRLNLSSLLAELTPNTHTWSRLKAALSVHRKSKVLLTPSSSRPAAPPRSPRPADLVDVSQDLFATPFKTPLPKRPRPPLPSRESLVAREDADLSDAEKVCAECGQPRPLPWEECVLPHRMKRCVKIGEGTFGEVFSTTNASGDTVALKVIPVEGSDKVNGEDQKTFGEILHEIIISKELSSLKDKQQNNTHGFIGLNGLHCVQGRYPPDFLNAWDAFDRQKGSENDRPDFFQTDQFFIILEFEFGGVDLENSNGTLTSLLAAKSILHQVTAALAVAEQELHFEHRDLHWGNVLVKTTTQKTGSFLLNGAAHSLDTKGVLVRIIDYSLSRLEIDDLTVSCDISNDEELFMGRGDYQFDIYRLMRQENGNNWSDYHPHTNVLWLHYLSSKLLSMKYRGSGGRGAKAVREELTRFHDDVLQYSSATEALRTSPMFQ